MSKSLEQKIMELKAQVKFIRKTQKNFLEQQSFIADKKPLFLTQFIDNLNTETSLVTISQKAKKKQGNTINTAF
jgi:hypothetical protein